MEKNPIVSAYLDAEKKKEVDLINEEDVKFSLWLDEFEKDDSRDIEMADRFLRFVRVGNNLVSFDLAPGERVKKTVNYFRGIIAFQKGSDIAYLDSAFETLIREYHGEPDIIDGIIKFRVALIKKWGVTSFLGSIEIVRDILEGRNPILKFY